MERTARERHAEAVAEQRRRLSAATTDAEREAILYEYAPIIGTLNSAMQREDAPEPSWHTAPDGTPCCCTAEDRMYGVGCK